jgi:hypothetical protein
MDNKKLVLSIILVIAGFLGVKAQQEFVFNKCQPIEKVVVTDAEVQSHYMGNDIAYLFYVLKSTYTFIIPGTPASPGDKIQIEKPVVYNAIRKISKHYKKSIKKGIITSEEAKQRMTRILEAGICIFFQETSELETAIRKAKKPDPIEQVFLSIRFD